MNTVIQQGVRDTLALEQRLTILSGVQRDLIANGDMGLGLALEADAALGASYYSALRFSTNSHAAKQKIALEGIAGSVWDTIKKLLKNVGTLIKRFISWLQGEGKRFDPAHLEQVTGLGQQVGNTVDSLTSVLTSGHLRERFEETLYSALMAKLPAADRAILDGNSEYSKAVVGLSKAFDQGDYNAIIEKGVASLMAWYATESQKASVMDATDGTTHADIETYVKSLEANFDNQQDSQVLTSLTARHSLDLTKGRYEAIKQAKTVIASHQYAPVPKEVSALKSTVLTAQSKIKIVAASKSMQTAQRTLEEMGKHIETIALKIDRLADQGGEGKVLIAEQAVCRAFATHLRALMDSFQTVLSAHEFLYEVWREVQLSMIRIWQQMIVTYDAVVVDEVMSDAQRVARADLEKKAKTALKDFAGLI